MGGIALSAWRHSRNTQDVDLLIGVDRDRFDAILKELLAAGFRAKRSPLVITVDEQEIAQFLYTPIDEFYDLQIDLLRASSPYQQVAIERRVPLVLPGMTIPVAVLTCEDLILHKLLSGRMIDRADASMLLRENRAELELPYITGWVGSQNLSREFAEIWGEAFPGEPPPIV